MAASSMMLEEDIVSGISSASAATAGPSSDMSSAADEDLQQQQQELLDNPKWLSAHYDPVASVRTFTGCMTLADLHGDGECKLILADFGTGQYSMKLKVYKGTAVMSENTIIDLPTGVCAFLMDTTEPRTPAVAVASGPYIYIYKNLRPYFKFTLPSLDINPTELEVWAQAKAGAINVDTMKEMLEELRGEVGESQLTSRSQHLLMLDSGHNSEQFIDVHKHSVLRRQTVITCISTLRKSLQEEDAISCLVIGTEDKKMYVLDPEAFTILATIALPSVPVFFNINGMFDVDYRIVAACRNGNMYTIRRGAKEASSKSVINLTSQAVGLERINKSILVGCMDQTLNCYTTKGKHMWSVKMPDIITTMELMDYPNKGIKAVLIALENCEIHIYRDKFLLDVLKTEDVVTAMRFGKFGREDGVLVMVTKSGGLVVKILKRTAEFQEKMSQAGPPPAQNIKLNIPKKTKLFVDQTMRERENSVSMHRTFQHDLYLLRLNTARSFVKTLESSINPVSFGQQEKLYVNAVVLGLGPTFKLIMSIKNLDTVPCINLFITFVYDHTLYTMHQSFMPLPMLVPSIEYKFDSNIDCSNQEGLTGDIKCLVMKKGQSIPIVTAIVNMPVSESLIAM